MTYSFSDETIEKVRSSNDLLDIVSKYVILKRTGSNYTGLCPFHTEKTPSFTVSPSKQLYYCFGCGEGGDVIKFIMKIEDLSFPDAIKFLAEKAGITIEEKENKINRELKLKKQKLYRINREAAIYFYKNLIKNKRALKYLYKRHIDDKLIKVFGLGYSLDSWNDLYNYLMSKGYVSQDVEQTGLIIKKKNKNGYYDRFRNRIIFPIIDVKRRILGFGGRILNNEKPKYLNSPDTLIFSKGYNLFGLNLIKKYSNREKIILVEGYMDVVSLFGNNIKYVVASLGTAFTPNQAKLIKRYGNEVFICYDSDQAGLKAVNRALDIFKEQNINAKVIVLPDGTDPDDFINDYGTDEFEKLISKSLNYIDFKIYLSKKKYDLSKIENKILFTKNITHLLKKVNDPIEIDAYIKKISQESGISIKAIEKEISNKKININNQTIGEDKYRNNNYRNNNYKIKPIRNTLKSANFIAEKNLINIFIKDKKIYENVKDKLRPEDFRDSECRKIAKLIYKLYKKENNIDISYIIRYFKNIDDQQINKIIKILESDIDVFEGKREEIVEDFIYTINCSKLKDIREKIIKEIGKIDGKKEKNKGDVEKSKELCLKLSKINKQLNSHQ